MVNKNMKYQNGKIYSIRNHIDDDVYIGSTVVLLSKRMVKHRCEMNRNTKFKVYTKMNELGVDKFYIELIENFPCGNKEELRQREGHFIRELGTLNSSVAGRTKKMYNDEFKYKYKEYREINKVEILKTKKEYRINHKEEIAAYDKKHYDEKTNYINEKLVCDCGRTYSRQHKAAHIKTKIHQQLMSEKLKV